MVFLTRLAKYRHRFGYQSLAASISGFVCHRGCMRQSQDACAYRESMGGLRRTTHGSTHTPHMRCKPKENNTERHVHGSHVAAEPTLVPSTCTFLSIWGITRTERTQGSGWAVARSMRDGTII